VDFTKVFCGPGPVVPEAPAVILLGVSALAVFGGPGGPAPAPPAQHRRLAVGR